MEFNSEHKNINDVRKLSMEQYKARRNFDHANKNRQKFTSNRKHLSKRLIRIDSLSEREIQLAMQKDEIIPGLQDDSSSTQESNPGSQNEKIFLAATKSPNCLGTKKTIVEEPEILTLSSDEDEPIANSSRIDGTICQKEPVITNNMTFSPYLDCLIEDDGVQYINLSCRAIRIGTYKYIPTGTIAFSKHSLKFTAPAIDSTDLHVAVHVPLECVVKILCSLEIGFNSIFIYLTPPFASHLRKQLNMKQEDGPYYDPCSSEESQKRLIIFIDKISEMLCHYFLEMYKNRRSFLNNALLEQLTRDEANCILMNSAPYEIHSLLKKPSVTATACKTLLIYPPPPSKGRITINVSDYECLAEEQFLNDVVLDFYLKWLHLEKLPDAYRNRTHVFSTFFYKRLTAKPKKNRRNDPHEIDEKLLPAQKRHARVKSWTKGINIFEKDFLLFPINERSHWFLAVICFPGMHVNVPEQKTRELPLASRQSKRVRKKVHEELLLDMDWSDRDEAESDEELNGIDEFRDGKFSQKQIAPQQSKCVKHPCILIFDSLKGSNRSRIVSTLREYLQVEYQERNGSRRDFTKQNMEGFLPNVPQQMNYSDCGIYTLQFAESFFDDPINNYKLPIRTLENWFPEEVVLGKRESIATLIKLLMIDANNPNSHPVPDIKFPSKKKRKLSDSETESQEVVRGSQVGKRKTSDDELQGNDFNPISIQNVNSSAKKISLNLSSKTIANAKDMRAELDKYCLPNFPNSLQMIKNSYSDAIDDSQKETRPNFDDIYCDLDPNEGEHDSSKESSSHHGLVQSAKKIKLSSPDELVDPPSNKLDHNKAPR